MKRFYFLLLLVTLFNVVACNQNEKFSLIPKGVSSFIYQNGNLNKGQPITVYSYLPSNYKDNSPVLGFGA